MSYTDRFRVDSNFQQPVAPSRRGGVNLERMIERACNPTLLEPDLALNLEIADLINQKKGSYPREAAVAIVKLINSRTPQTSVLALGLLDICVKNCGYPFHLQISRKEFLNELVRRFPEKPPMAYTRTQTLILEAIEEWRETICKTSRYKEDLGYIRDMHRLLSFKGYSFPEVNTEDAAVLNPTDTLRSAQEIEEEEREAQSAKLQELIRRATPADLQEANRLMGIMSGYKKESKNDYHARVAKDLDKLRRKAELLEEMINNNDNTIPEDNVFSEIADSLKNAHPKILKMAQEEQDSDHEAAIRLSSFGEYINGLTNKFDLLKAGNVEAANQIAITRPQGSENPPQKTSASNQQLIESLIDIDDDNGQQQQQQQQETPSSSSTTAKEPENLIDALDGLSFGNIALGSGSGSPQPPASQQPQSSNTNSLLDFSSPQSAPSPQPASTSTEDDWTFASAVPATSSPAPATATSATLDILNNPSGLKITFEFTKQGNGIQIKSVFSNNSPTSTISQLNFQLAVPKSYTLHMDPQSGTTIQAFAAPVTQQIKITPAPSKLRWKVSYMINGVVQNQDGQTDNLPQL
ncbi:hypothetical protein TRICI_005606 [Trichomonascus ciferrii]|uniref:VHS domain-containing protein n=1 Tax=Trichomonascus ciferrii TaxID=44093 RepID=A0A642URK2_9ASCO|nr:hypothetical protein TRICI_005606 [Trichomonascus ciferrii]